MRLRHLIVLTVLGIAAASAAATDAPLARAVKTRDAAAVRTLLRQRADVNAADAETMTPLHWAAHWNDIDTVRLLLRAGAKANVANRYGVTPLHEACTVGSLPIIDALVEAGADPNAALGEGETPLMTAARAGNAAAVRRLALAGGNVNARESFRGQTALMWAADENHADVVRLLIELGADVNARSTTYEFPTLTGGNGGIIHDRPTGGLTALMFAARQGSAGVVDPLVAAGADLNASEPQYGFTPLQTAIFNGHYDLAARLIEKGADVNDGALYTTIEMRNLAAYSNRPNPPDTDVRVSSLDVVKLLLERGADPNRAYAKKIPPRQAQGDIAVPKGATPLYRAARSTDIAATRLLLAKGADPSRAIADGSTPLMLAAGLGARRANDEDVAEKTARADPLELAKLLVDAGAPVNAANDAGNTALHYAAQNGAGKIVEFLLGNGAAVDAKNKAGKTPLDLARPQNAALIRQRSQ